MWLIACATVHEIHFTIIVSLHLHMHLIIFTDLHRSFHNIDLIFQMNSIISINLMIKSPLQYTKVQCKTRIVGVNFYFACGILYRYNCKMVLRGQSNQAYSSGFKFRFIGFLMKGPGFFKLAASLPGQVELFGTQILYYFWRNQHKILGLIDFLVNYLG